MAEIERLIRVQAVCQMLLEGLEEDDELALLASDELRVELLLIVSTLEKRIDAMTRHHLHAVRG